MPTFAYKGRDIRGELITGVVTAGSADEAASEIFGRDITPIDIRESRRQEKRKPAAKADAGSDQAKPQESSADQIRKVFRGKALKREELMIFSRQMYSLTRSGMPLDRALHGLEASITSVPMKRVISDVALQLEKGMNLTDALSRHPQAFTPLFLSLVHVGENTGRLDIAFQQISKYLQLEQDTSKQIKSATRYPSFVVVAIAVALAVIMVFVIPVFKETFDRMGAQLPWQTTLLINLSDFTVQWWPWIIGTMVTAYLLFRRMIASGNGRERWDQRKLKFPLVGSVYERIALSRFSRTFAMMMKAGVPIVQALGVISRAVGNQYVGRKVLGMRDAISHGESLHVAAQKTRMFSPLALQMIAVGEETGTLDELLDEVADFYDSEVEYDLKKMGSAIEPLLIVVIAGMVLMLALGVFLPIWDLANASG